MKATSSKQAGGDPIEHAWNAWLTAHPVCPTQEQLICINLVGTDDGKKFHEIC